MAPKKTWTPEQDTIVKIMAEKGFAPEDIATKVGKTPSAVVNRVYKTHRLGFKRATPGKYRRSEKSLKADEVVKMLYPTCTLKEIGAVLDITPLAVHMRAHKLGLSKNRHHKNGVVYTKAWVLEQLRRVHSGEATMTQIAQEYGIHLSMVSLLLNGKRGPLAVKNG